MKVALIVSVPGPMHGKEIPLTLTRFLIGSAPQAHLQAADPQISPQHCVLSLRDDKVFLQDLGSRTGTIVNNRPIKEEVQLRDGDGLKIGPLLFTMRIQANIPKRIADTDIAHPALRDSSADTDIAHPALRDGSADTDIAHAALPPDEILEKVSLTVLVPGPLHGQSVPITVPKFVIGRNSESHLQAADPAISPKHCALSVRDNRVYLQDLGSATGTIVNDQPINAEVQLREGDRFKVGSLIFGVHMVFRQPVPAKPKPKLQETGTAGAAAQILKNYLRERKKRKKEEEEGAD